MEQSRVLVDEIQRETRRRKQSISTERRSLLEDREQEDAVTLSNVEGSTADVPSEENESFWNRITRRVIRDLMGIDDDLLSIIFGEALPEDDDLSTTPPANGPFDAAHSIIAANQQYDQSSWEYRLLERIARELGILVSPTLRPSRRILHLSTNSYNHHFLTLGSPSSQSPSAIHQAPPIHKHQSKLRSLKPSPSSSLLSRKLGQSPYRKSPQHHWRSNPKTQHLEPQIHYQTHNHYQERSGSVTSISKWSSATSANASPLNSVLRQPLPRSIPFPSPLT